MEREPGLRFSISYTTRPQRPTEQHGRDYFFVDREEFERMVAARRVPRARARSSTTTTAPRAGRSRQSLAAGQDLILEIDWQGAAQVRAALPECVSIFILPPSRPELERRLRGRGTDAEDVIQRRLRDAAGDMAPLARVRLRGGQRRVRSAPCMNCRPSSLVAASASRRDRAGLVEFAAGLAG